VTGRLDVAVQHIVVPRLKRVRQIDGREPSREDRISRLGERAPQGADESPVVLVVGAYLHHDERLALEARAVPEEDLEEVRSFVPLVGFR
jgi:hypothetical protein